MLLIIAVTLAAVLAPLTSAGAGACLSCPRIVQGPPCQEFWRADAVFVGLAVEVKTEDWLKDGLVYWSRYRRLTARIVVEESFRGLNEAELTMTTTDCPYLFRQGERYLVYAQRNREGLLEVRDGWSRTAPLAEADEDLAYLRKLSATGTGSRVYGAVKWHAHDMKEGRSELKPLAGAKIVLEGAARRAEAVADASGRFEFDGIAAGVYRLRAEISGRGKGKEFEIKAPAHGCVPVTFTFEPEGFIGGRVLDAQGRPLAGVEVSILPADGADEAALAGNRGAWANTDREGRYGFGRLLAGRYLIIVNRIRKGEMFSKRGPQIFHPGVEALAHAVAISLEDDQQKRDQDVNLPPR
ncbi:MAG: carboxypeptidase-like regulatory domain-containing protein [Acidobacteriota bacterium]|nr:carboxypeptidase-like regulatory domain-containing protein [Acidobacteriota bacterium]